MIKKQGIIVKAISGFYYVCCDGVTYECKARGSFRQSGVSPVVGDRAEISVDGNNKGVVESVGQRKNLLYRPAIANIDKLFIVSSFSVPAPDTLMIDRLTAIAVYHGIEPVIIFNKSDLGDFSMWQRIYHNAGFHTYVVSAQTGQGIDALESELDCSVCAFTGNSGVGKSSILNVLFGEIRLVTGEVSDKLGRGRHTTRHTELYPNGHGGYVADTPGFSSIETGRDDYGFKEQLPSCFPDFSDYADNCRFTSCTHTCEKGCGVLKAVSEGKIEPSRHKSYCAVFEELKDLKPWNSSKK